MGKKFYIKNLICNKSVLVINNNKTFYTDNIDNKKNFKNNLYNFDISNLNSLLNSGTVSKSSTYYLSLRATQATDLPVNHSVEISAVSQSWSNGNGSYGDYPNITQGASWRYRDGYFNGLKQ